MEAIQPELISRECVQLLQDDIALEFEEWKEQPGARHVLNYIYRIAYPRAKRFQRTGQRVSVRLLWELTRDHIGAIRARMQARGLDVQKWRGYRLNDHMHALVARHIIQHKPDWAGMFEIRERNR